MLIVGLNNKVDLLVSVYIYIYIFFFPSLFLGGFFSD